MSFSEPCDGSKHYSKCSVRVGACSQVAFSWPQEVSSYICTNQYFANKWGRPSADLQSHFSAKLSPLWYSVLGTLSTLLSMNSQELKRIGVFSSLGVPGLCLGSSCLCYTAQRGSQGSRLRAVVRLISFVSRFSQITAFDVSYLENHCFVQCVSFSCC